jgi:hypothetical protein
MPEAPLRFAVAACVTKCFAMPRYRCIQTTVSVPI